MEWLQVLLMTFGNIAWILPLFLWTRAEARADARHADAENKELRKELAEVLKSIKEEGRIFREKWAEECKDFHGRLCAIEENRKRN